ncbi:MAG TPA: VOC family protein [Gaiellaceae bacterium]|nr:VOC family protein [Gaiellaceae bacterium]
MLRLRHITFACDDPARVAEFWCAVLGYEREQRGASFAGVDPRGEGPELFFNRMVKSRTIELPIHLDVNVPDRKAEVGRLLELGAKLVETKTTEAGELIETWTVMRDPEGTGFCVQGPDVRKPHPYIRNVTFACAEPRVVVGPFWSAALDWPEQEIPADFVQMLANAGVDVEREFYAYYAIAARDSPLRLLFQRREKSRADSYPIHLDLVADDRQAEIDRLVHAGATLESTKSDERSWTVMRDPEGNPFCVE